MDRIIRAIAGNGNIKITAISSKDLTEKARRIHGMTAVTTAALGRTLAATSMMGNALKEDNASLTIRINGGGPAGSIIAVSDSCGNVRGYVQNPRTWCEPKENGKLDVGAAVGVRGMLTVMRDYGSGDPYVGSTQLVSGEIAEDFTRYFAESEQTPSAVGLGVLVSKADNTVLAAGGYIVQLLPGASDLYAERIEENIRSGGSVTSALLGNDDPQVLVDSILSGLDPEILETDPVEYRCYCNRERVLSAISAMGEEELEDIRKEGKTIEVSCQFCDKIYRFDPSEI